jgi:predicted nucleotide-binding protein (sugar kinase/HSP70/actin superfamily)
MKLGRRYVSGKECYPCAITTGDMVRKAFSSGFDPRSAVFFMPSGAGPCRFGQYNILHRMVLDEIGFEQVPIYAPNQDESFYTDLGIVGNEFTKYAWKGILSVDLLSKCLHETRPYEVNKGETDAVYSEYLKKIHVTLASGNGNMPALITKMKHDFSSIQRNSERKPLIGIIGEVFVRLSAFANEDIIRKVEDLGGEVWLAPLEEWLHYINLMGFRKAFVRFKSNAFSKKNTTDVVGSLMAKYVKKKVENEYTKPLEGFLKTLHEPDTKTLLKNASPYVHDSFEGETVLSMGKAIDFVNKGASGIISAIPFGCMPGIIVSALLKGLKQDTDIPCLNVTYDGAEATGSEIQLEAFMHQTHEYMVTKDKNH